LYGTTAGVTSTLHTSNGNLHIDAASGAYATYLNYYRGTGGVYFGNGASGSSANVTAAGAYTGTSLNVGSGAITSGLINGQTISSAANFTGTLNVATSVTSPYYYVTAGNGYGVGYWGSAPSTYGTFMSNSGTYQYGDVNDYYIANVMSSGTGRGFTWSYESTPSMALNASSGNLAIKGDFTLTGGDIKQG
ncbi:hypothetical protein GW879_02055, partial [Candidatus Kaiserbacteria bacterium]|nr:hypothetical protein [Candidatus Kaiserbacteria bacterium]